MFATIYNCYNIMECADLFYTMGRRWELLDLTYRPQEVEEPPHVAAGTVLLLGPEESAVGIAPLEPQEKTEGIQQEQGTEGDDGNEGDETCHDQGEAQPETQLEDPQEEAENSAEGHSGVKRR